MPQSLETMASKGYEKLTRKADVMKTAWNAAKTRMKSHYEALPFGPTRTSNYKSEIDAAEIRFDPEKWRENWLAKMRE